DVVRAAEAYHFQDRLNAHQLQRDVRHGGQNAGQRHRQRQRTRAVATTHEVSRCDIAVAITHRPQACHVDEDYRIKHDGVGNGEETADSAQGEEGGGHDHDRVRAVAVTAAQEPGYPVAEGTATETPFIKAFEVLALTPVR